MFDKEIEFSTHEDYFLLKEDYPIPTKLNIPEWYKKIDSYNIENRSIKGCIPFLDTLTSGYLLKIPQDLKIRHNVKDDNGNNDSFYGYSLQSPLFQNLFLAKGINLNSGKDDEIHSKMQVGECPYVEKNKNLNFYKILNPWKIKTPRGYSCLFVPPLNNTDDRFSIIPGIVDTDNHPIEINFPIVINGDKYPVLETIITKGTPYVQIIPFKRDNWKMSIQATDQKTLLKNKLWYNLKLINVYKDKIWKKKLWK
jgi:hypothetical protein